MSYALCLDDKGIAPSLIAAREQLQRSRLEVSADLLHSPLLNLMG